MELANTLNELEKLSFITQTRKSELQSARRRDDESPTTAWADDVARSEARYARALLELKHAVRRAQLGGIDVRLSDYVVNV